MKLDTNVIRKKHSLILEHTGLYSDGLRAERLGLDPWLEKEIFLFTAAPRLGLVPTQPPISWAPGALSPGVKRPGCEADYSPPTSAEFKNVEAIPPSPKRLQGVMLN
jgi:hypothetical protein